MSDPVSDLKQELLAAAERQHGHAPGPRSRRGEGVWAAIASSWLAALSIAAAAALLFTAPWSSSPGFLASSEAALTPPAGTVLHVRWERDVDLDGSRAARSTVGPNEIWIDQTPPHRYRVVLNDFRIGSSNCRSARCSPCSSGTPSELGGAFGTGETLRFVPPNTLSVNPLLYLCSLDPVTELRRSDQRRTRTTTKASRSSTGAPSNGSASIPRRVYRCRCPLEPLYWYVDPETFYPVETHSPGVIVLPVVPSCDSAFVMRYLIVRVPAPNGGQPRAHRHPRTTPGRDRTIARAVAV